MKRSAFTLLETLLAAALGSALVLMVIGMMTFMDNAEARQSYRLEQMDGMTRLHTVMTRAFSTLVVADPNSATAFRAAVNSTPGTPPGAAREPPARLVLGPDDSSGLKDAMRRARLPGGGSVQRLEVVLERPPVPRNFARGLTGSLSTSAQANSDQRDDELRGRLVGPVRGVFELRPDDATFRSGSAQRRGETRQGWTLWWRPLIDADSLNLDPTEDPEAVPIVAGLARCVWKGFMKRERLEKLRVLSTLELPAYMEMEAETLGGQHANWMFEVQWSVGGDGSEDEPPTPGVPGTVTEGGRTRAVQQENSR